MEDHVLLDTLSGLGFKSNGQSATILVISTNFSEIQSHSNMKLNHRRDWLHIAWSLIISAVHFVIISLTQYLCFILLYLISIFTKWVWIDISSHVTLEMFILLLILLHVCCLIIRNCKYKQNQLVLLQSWTEKTNYFILSTPYILSRISSKSFNIFEGHLNLQSCCAGYILQFFWK